MVFANSPPYPTSIWFSLQDNIYYFNNERFKFTYDARPGVPKFDDVQQYLDPYEYKLVDELSREIRWVYPSKDLEFGTDIGEFTYSGFTALPEKQEISFESSYGSVYQNPLKVGNATIFILKDGKTLGRILFDFNSQSNSVINLNVLAPNILNDFRTYYDDYDSPFVDRIVWDHVRRLVWILTSTGDVFSITTSFNIDTFGWQKHTL